VIRVAVVDDQPLVRMALTTLLEAQPDMDVVGQAADGAGALALARRQQPEVLLLDLRMPGTDGLTALRALTADPALTGVRVIVLTTFDLDEYVYEALHHGASGFLTKDAEPDELVRAVRVVAAGDALLSPGVTRRLLGAFSSGARGRSPHPAIATLTPREAEVASLVAEGLTNDEIARRLFLSPATVRTHVGRAMTKLDARDRAQLVVIALRSGLG